LSPARAGWERPRFTDNCASCGAAIKDGAERCPFCGKRVASPVPAHHAGTRPSRAPGGVLATVVVACIVLAAAFAARRLGEQPPPPPPSPPALEAKRQAAAACEERVRREVRSPFRVTAFRSGLVAEDQAGHVVTGTVELQSVTGDLQRRRYRCRVTRGAAGPVVEEGRLE
jgi:hypothetical protein